MAQEWLSVKELAERLNIQPASVRMKAKRGQWERKKDNYGVMRYAIDLDDPKFQKVTKPHKEATSVTQQLDNINETLSSRSASVTQALTAQIELLERQISLKDEQLEAASKEKLKLIELLEKVQERPSLFKRLFRL